MRSVIELHLEMTRHEGGMAHVFEFPGCCFRGENREGILARTAVEVGRYLSWCEEHGLTDVSSLVKSIIRARKRASSASGPAIVARVVEMVEGAPLWKSSQPAALFENDHEAMDDAGVQNHFRAARSVYQDVARLVSELEPAQLAYHIDDESRSLEETLTHVGDCVWWYCSRISDELPEPGEEIPAGGLARIQALLPQAEEFLLAFPLERRGEEIVPARFPSGDPQERWTHRKACRRLVEHMMEHLRGIAALREEVLERMTPSGSNSYQTGE